MRTQKQIEASRANGKKSRGPITEQGKARSSRNAIKHGLRAQTLTTDPEFDPLFAATLNRVRNYYRVTTEQDAQIAEAYAISISRLKRIEALETSSMNDEIARLGKDDPDFANLPQKTRIPRAWASLTRRSHIIERCGEYQGITMRVLDSTRKHLEKTRRDHISKENDPNKPLIPNGSPKPQPGEPNPFGAGAEPTPRSH